MAYITSALNDFFSEESIRLLGYMEWDSYELLENPGRIRLRDFEDNESSIPWFGDKIEVQDIPPQAYFCSCSQLSGGLASLVDYSGHFATIRCIYGYDWSWCGPGIVMRGSHEVVSEAMRRLEKAGVNVVCHLIDKAWYIKEKE